MIKNTNSRQLIERDFSIGSHQSGILGRFQIPRRAITAEFNLNGDALETSGFGNNGTATNVIWSDSTIGYQKQNASFNGSSARITYSRTGASATENTYSFWFNRSGNGSGENQILMAGGTAGQKAIAFRCQAGLVLEYLTGAFTAWQTIQSVSNSTWYHCIVIQDTSGSRAYINNQLIATNVGDTGVLGGTQGSAIGSNGNAAQDYFNGLIQNVRYYSFALSAKERELLYKEGLKLLH